MTEFLFVRHAEAVTNTQPGLVGGQNNTTPLTERGRQQAALFGKYLHSNAVVPNVVFSSGAIRADTTAAIALAQAGIELPLLHDDRLMEMSQGEYEGAPRTHVYSPENLEKYAITTMDGKLPGGESMREVQQRMAAFLEETSQTYPHERVLVFGHGLAIRALAGALRGFTKQAILAEQTNNVSLSFIETTPATPIVHFVGKNVIPEYT